MSALKGVSIFTLGRWRSLIRLAWYYANDPVAWTCAIVRHTVAIFVVSGLIAANLTLIARALTLVEDSKNRSGLELLVVVSALTSMAFMPLLIIALALMLWRLWVMSVYVEDQRARAALHSKKRQR